MRRSVARKKPAAAGICPHCGYVSDRPHAALCPRCNNVLPGAMGCSGCGACRSKG